MHPSTPDRRRRTGMTLVELVIVISIIGVLFTLFVPAIQRSREAARRAHCQNNLRQLGVGLLNYHDTHNTLPSGWTGVAEGRPAALAGPGWGWACQVLPQLDNLAVVTMIRFDQSIMSVSNQQVRTLDISVFRCPSGRSDPTWLISGAELSGLSIASSNYVGAFGSQGWDDTAARRVGRTLVGDGVFFHNSSTKFSDIADGLSNTVLVGERAGEVGRNLPSTWVGVVPGLDNAVARVVGTGETVPGTWSRPGRGFDSGHVAAVGAGAHFIFGDGRVEFVSDRITAAVFRALMSRSGGELTPGY